MAFNVWLIFVLFIFLWLVILSFIIYRIGRLYNQLIKWGVTTKWKETSGLGHLQRIGIVRYNPFSDTGGAQSFSLALLDAAGTGIVITSLFARTGNRWYVKEITGGKGKGIDLSKEEEVAIRKAQS